MKSINLIKACFWKVLNSPETTKFKILLCYLTAYESSLKGDIQVKLTSVIIHQQQY